MNITNTASVKTATETVKPTRSRAKSSVKEPSETRRIKSPVMSKSAPEKPQTAELPVENQIAPFVVKNKKSEKKKVIRDSFSFPEQDYHKISELKKICLAAGVHVKKGEILRAGLNLLTSLKLSELMQAVEKVERVRTGRPKSE